MQEPGSQDDEETPSPGCNPQRKEPTDPVPIEEPEQPASPEDDRA